MKNQRIKTAAGITLALLLGLAGGYTLKESIDERAVVKAHELHVPVRHTDEPLIAKLHNDPLIANDPFASDAWKVALDSAYVPAGLGMEPLVVPSLFEKTISVPEVKTVEGGKEIQVTAQVPGLTEKDIVVEAGKNYVTIKGHRVIDQKDSKNRGFSTSEETFVRTVQLPCNVDGKNVKATVKDGVLTVSLPKLNSIAQKKGNNVQ